MKRSNLGAKHPISPLRDQVARIARADSDYTRLTSAGRTTCPLCCGVGMAGRPHERQDGWGGTCIPAIDQQEGE